MRILQLRSENIKRIKAVEITPDGKGGLVIISGKNEQGKTSVLDSIMAALGGKEAIPKEPIHRGAAKASVRLDLGEFIVERKFTKSDSYLKITAKDGSEIKSPQQLLDKMVGKLSFDPLEFVRYKADEQVKILRTLTGVDFNTLDADRLKNYNERTLINRDLDKAKTMLSSLPEIEAPEEEVSVVALTEELEGANAITKANDQIRENLRDSKTLLDKISNDKETLVATKNRLLDELSDLNVRVDTLDERQKKGQEVVEQLEEKVKSLEDPNTKPITDAIANSEATNRNVRQKKDRALKLTEVSKLQKESDVLSTKISSIDQQKHDMIVKAKMPIDGLTFDETGIRVDGTLFSELSDSQKLKAGLAISIAINPQIKVILIRDGSLLDSTNLAIIRDMAEKADAQVWLEKVDESGKIGVVIEDGEVVTEEQSKQQNAEIKTK